MQSETPIGQTTSVDTVNRSSPAIERSAVVGSIPAAPETPDDEQVDVHVVLDDLPRWHAIGILENCLYYAKLAINSAGMGPGFAGCFRTADARYTTYDPVVVLRAQVAALTAERDRMRVALEVIAAGRGPDLSWGVLTQARHWRTLARGAQLIAQNALAPADITDITDITEDPPHG